MYDSYKIAERIRIKLKEEGITSKKMLEELGFGKETILTMEKGSMIKCDRLGMIADYLKCSVDYLLGRELPQEQEKSINQSISGIALYSPQSIGKKENISGIEEEVLKAMQGLKDSDKAKVLVYICELKEKIN